MKTRLSPRTSLVIIAALFMLPLALAWFMYSGAIEYKPSSTRNFGQLVEPPVPMVWEVPRSSTIIGSSSMPYRTPAWKLAWGK